MGSLSFLDDLVKVGMYTPEQRTQIIVNFGTNSFLKSKPTMNQAHRVRTVMQSYYFMKEGAIEVSDEGKISINIEKWFQQQRKCLQKSLKFNFQGI